MHFNLRTLQGLGKRGISHRKARELDLARSSSFAIRKTDRKCAFPTLSPLRQFHRFIVSELSTHRLFELIETKLHLLTQMLELTVEQSDVVHSQDMEALFALLSKKQQLMDSLQSIQQQLVPFQSQDPERREWESAEKRIDCQTNVERCDRLIQQLVVLENRSIDNMVVQRETVASQLKQNADASQIQHAYHASDVEPIETSSISLTG